MLFILILVTVVVQEIMCSSLSYTEYGLSLPAHIYYVKCKEDQPLTGTLNWTESTINSLKIYIYKSGSDLLGTHYMDHYADQQGI